MKNIGKKEGEKKNKIVEPVYIGTRSNKTGATLSNGSDITAFPKNSYMDKYLSRKK